MRGRRRIKARAFEETKDAISSRIPRTSYTSKPNSSFDNVLSLQRTIGNRAVQRLFKSGIIQGKLKLNQPNDMCEQEADKVAGQVMARPKPRSQSAAHGRVPAEKTTAPSTVENSLSSSGRPLNPATRELMESQFGADFSHVRTHTDSEAAHVCRELSAEAFTHKQDIYYGEGKGPDNNELTAHELTHVVQQTAEGKAVVQRKLQLRPPGKGEASAFGRAQELVDRLNTLSPAITYELKGRELVYTVKDAPKLTHFDTVMKGFIDRADVVPMRLITSKGYVGGGPVFADLFIEGYVDLDDLLADDIYSFQSDLLHLLTERFQVKDYARRIGTNLAPLFPKAHRAGKEAEAAQLRALFKDPTIVFVYEETKPNDTWVNAFKSKDHGYWVFQVARKSEREVAGGEMWVRKKDGTKVSIEDFMKERAAAGP